MKDFTLERYAAYLKAIQLTCPNILFVHELTGNNSTDSFCVIRHDVDRKPSNALEMAELEHSLGVHATYYFRTKRHTFKPEIIEAIGGLGHAIGYHYECLSDTHGNRKAALSLFETNLHKLRELAPVHTIAMHGRPFSRYDNRDMWRSPEHRRLLREKYNIVTEVYLDIDYRDIYYISDTGRNWSAQRANIRDHVDSDMNMNFTSSEELLYFLERTDPRKIMLQIHPERWAASETEYYIQLTKDTLINCAKRIVEKI